MTFYSYVHDRLDQTRSCMVERLFHLMSKIRTPSNPLVQGRRAFSLQALSFNIFKVHVKQERTKENLTWLKQLDSTCGCRRRSSFSSPTLLPAPLSHYSPAKMLQLPRHFQQSMPVRYRPPLVPFNYSYIVN